MRGTTVWGVPFRLEIGDELFMLSDAVSWSSHERLEQPYVRVNGDILFQCSPGTVRARLA
jgi:hypothetical protein